MISTKMIFYYVILLCLSWPQTRCTEDADLKGEEIYDQFATASETVVHAAKESNKDSKELQKQFSSIPSSTVHYENSNGFVPMIQSASPSVSYYSSQTRNHEQQNSEESNVTDAVSAQDSSDARAKKLEEDLAYSSEARIFLSLPRSLTNRRSFDLQDGKLNEFELLKVNNDTPAVANYQDFYENVRSTVSTQTDSESRKSSSRRPKSERGKRLEGHTHNYGWQSQQNNDQDIYAQFYSHNGAQDTKKTVYGQEKVAGNYQQQNTANYNELSAAKQNAAAIPSSSRTNYEANELAHSGTHSDTGESPRTRHRFMKPVVVAEPSNHKVDVKFSSQQRNSESDNDDKTLKNLKSSSSEISSHYDAYNTNSRQRSYHRTEDSREFSDEDSDYIDYVDQSRSRLQKNRKRPDTIRKLPKEHRGTLNESAEEGKYAYSSSRLKTQRPKVKANPWLNDPNVNHHDESIEDIRYDSSRSSSTKTKTVKHKPTNTNTWNQISPNLEISHSNGIELDQLEKPKYVVNFVPVGNFDHATALGGSQGFDMSNAMLQNLATVAPLGAFSTATPLLSTPQSLLAQNLAISKNLVSTPVPDVIVGQNTFHNPMQTVLLSHPNGQNKFADTLRATYVPSTMTPIFAFTPGLQGLSVHGVQNNVTPRTTFAVVPQPTIQSYPSFIQTPLQATQIQSLPTGPTLLSSHSVTEGRANPSAETHGKKNVYSTSGGNFLATASLAVGQNEQKQAANVNTYYVHGQNAQVIPNQQLAKGGKQSPIVFQTADSSTSHSNNLNTLGATSGNAHLPNVGAKNVEIVNPNIKLNPLTNTYQTMYPATVVTTPIPIFSTIASATPQTAVNLQNYVNSLTQSGGKIKQVDLKPSQNQEQPMFNPINFVPNIDIIKNQNVLNSKLRTNEPLQSGLNLVPAMPGGNFFKPFTAQNELMMKPKLASDLQKYAEEMFKESLKTMYNSQKWNNDRRPGHIPNNLEANDLTKLRIELQKLRNSLTESKYRDILEGHQSEDNIHTTDAPRSSGKKKLEPLLATLEHLIKTRGIAGPIHMYHGAIKPGGRKPKQGDSNFAGSSNYMFHDDGHIEFLTPPRSPGRFHPKAPFHDKLIKKRPGSRYKNGPRKLVRVPVISSHKPGTLKTSSSNIEIYLDGTHRKQPRDVDFENDYDFESKHRSFHESHPSFTTSAPEVLSNILREIKNNKEYDINHPRMHNLLGLLMKNKQLPNRGAQNYYRDNDQARHFFDRDRRRPQQQFYNDALRDYVDRSDIATQSASVAKGNVYSGNGTA
ncbi:uncharacterized protein LOC105194932 isoform X2 [Solenopsis invicta]|uniref:uncharacterized protein LOC105194932 isoform X2 n=1 Tax=Solenopsis invicta TaxID=13686 RepID=UPI00193E46FD|nr:uncharacterized protein LOC105194932 isoform X2 [Solenopsis invicta]